MKFQEFFLYLFAYIYIKLRLKQLKVLKSHWPIYLILILIIKLLVFSFPPPTPHRSEETDKTLACVQTSPISAIKLISEMHACGKRSGHENKTG